MNIKNIIRVTTATLLLYSCTSKSAEKTSTIYVSIEPLKYLVEQITGSDFEVEVLVPMGASPETFEPTPRQFIELNRCQKIFATGLLDFEQSLLKKVQDDQKIINLSRNIELIAGSCSHTHHGKHCHHGVDPHIWCSPKALQTMSETVFDVIRADYPDSTKYEANYDALCQKLLDLDEEITEKASVSPHKAFLIYHPALTYFARDYNLEQIAIENEGKEASAKRMSDIITRARQEGINKVLYQCEFPLSSVETICKDIDATPYEINPLSGDPITTIREFSYIILND